MKMTQIEKDKLRVILNDMLFLIWEVAEDSHYYLSDRMQNLSKDIDEFLPNKTLKLMQDNQGQVDLLPERET